MVGVPTNQQNPPSQIKIKKAVFFRKRPFLIGSILIKHSLGSSPQFAYE